MGRHRSEDSPSGKAVVRTRTLPRHLRHAASAPKTVGHPAVEPKAVQSIEAGDPRGATFPTDGLRVRGPGWICVLRAERVTAYSN